MRTALVTLTIGLFVLPANAKYSGGTGEPNDPYQIATAADLIALGETPEDYDKHFILTAEIDLDPNLPGRKAFNRAVIAPDMNDAAIGFQGPAFTGTLDGQGHAIAGLVIDSNVPYAGLFGAIGSRGCVCNVHIVGGSVRGYAFYSKTSDGGLLMDGGTGSLAGVNQGLIKACWSTGLVNGNGRVGGLAGWNFCGTVLACWSTSSVSGNSEVGGLVGSNNYGVILACYDTGPVSGKDNVGGLVGYHFFGTVSSCYSTGSVRGTMYVGGLVGCNSSAVIAECYSMGSVIGNDNVGGLVGRNFGATSACFWDVETSGQPKSFGGTGLTTAQMAAMRTFTDVGWDFLGERANGLSEYWQMPAGGGYPLLSVFNGYVPHSFQGRGTSDAPYLIERAEDLGAVWYHPMASYRLVADVDLSGTKWGMGVIPAFWGSLDGQGHRITRMTVLGGGYLGLIGRLFRGAVVKDLGLEDVNNVGSSEQVGGLAGYSLFATISACYTTGSVTGSEVVGGLTGTCYHSVISNCRSEASVRGTREFSGGLVGFSYYGTILSCYTTGPVSGNDYVGGLVGYNGNGAVSACYSTGKIVGTGSCVGGLAGDNGSGTISACRSTGPVDGVRLVGGLAGANGGGTISACYSTGSVSGKDYAGGLVGSNYSGSISGCYSTGWVSESNDVGGLAGSSDNKVSACFWDTQTSRQTSSADGTGKMTAEMQTARTFLDAGWDFVSEAANGSEDIWWIEEGKDYPRLWWELGDEASP